MPFDQFLPEYFAECDEHLAAIRRLLLQLEERGGAVLEPAGLQALMRALHTLKGLSAMVGLGSAERVAHALEEGLRAAEPAVRPLSPDEIGFLFTGVSLLESCIAARRDERAPPVVEPYVSSVAEHLGRGRTSPGAAPHRAAGSAAAGENAVRYAVEFAPAPELAARGVGVELVRSRLAGMGRLVSALPRVGEGGRIAFEFVVDVPPGAAFDEGWRGDNMSWRELVPEAPPAPAAAAESAEPAGSVRLGSGGVLRVELSRVDDLMRLIGELVVTRARLSVALDQLPHGRRDRAWENVQETATLLERQLRSLREGITRIRLVQVGEAFERLRFAVREMASETGKIVILEVTGQDTEVDKVVVERVFEPLLHLVRNAVSHGIEPASERTAQGKPAEGRITLGAAAAGDRIVITVEDDGAGVDVERVRARARAADLLPPGGEEVVDLLDLLCAPGFSTREEADLASGRGVGLAVARTTIQQLGGTLQLESAPGAGTRFTIELPLTLLIVDALLVEVGGQVMAVPQPALREVFQAEPDAVTPLERNEVVPYRGAALPLLRLRRLFGLGGGGAGGFVLVVGPDLQPVGLVVDRFLGLREIVVQPLADPLVALAGIGGATQLGDGRVSLVLDVGGLLRLRPSTVEARPRG